MSLSIFIHIKYESHYKKISFNRFILYGSYSTRSVYDKQRVTLKMTSLDTCYPSFDSTDYITELQ